MIAVGTCPKCGAGVATESDEWGTRARCPRCDAALTLKAVAASFNAARPCDDRCQYARLPVCSCACGGANHSRGYIAPPELIPAWVVTRDAAEHVKRTERAAERKAAARESKQAKIDAIIAEHPSLVVLVADVPPENSFLWDLSSKLRQYGDLSERQIVAAERVVAEETRREAARVAREAEKAARAASGVAAPTGRTVVAGVVTFVKAEEDNYSYNGGIVWKMRVADDRGFTTWGTVPAGIRAEVDKVIGDYVQAQGQYYKGMPLADILRGSRVSFTATLRPATDDATHAFANRPTGTGFTVRADLLS